MAKVTGPLLSLTASGTVGKTATFSHWKGKAYVRVRVIPLNPQSSGQQDVRTQAGTIAKAAHAVLTKFVDSMHVGSPFFTSAVGFAPAGQSWISWMQMTQRARFSDLQTAYAGIGSTYQGYYDDEAAVIGLADYTPPFVGATPLTAGFQLYILADFAITYLAYALSSGTLDAPTVGGLSDLGDFIHVTTP